MQSHFSLTMKPETQVAALGNNPNFVLMLLMLLMLLIYFGFNESALMKF